MATATMAPLTPAALGMGPRPFRWTISEYRELGKTGLFDNVKTMLLDGEIYVMALPLPPHDTALGLTEDYLRAIFTVGFHVRSQKGFDVGTKNDPGPDLAVVSGSIRDYANRTPNSAIIIVEVAFSTLSMDMTTKAELYATAGVADSG